MVYYFADFSPTPLSRWVWAWLVSSMNGIVIGPISYHQCLNVELLMTALTDEEVDCTKSWKWKMFYHNLDVISQPLIRMIAEQRVHSIDRFGNMTSRIAAMISIDLVLKWVSWLLWIKSDWSISFIGSRPAAQDYHRNWYGVLFLTFFFGLCRVMFPCWCL